MKKRVEWALLVEESLLRLCRLVRGHRGENEKVKRTEWKRMWDGSEMELEMKAVVAWMICKGNEELEKKKY